MSQTLKAAPVAAEAEPSVSDDLLARIVTETERQVTAKASRPAPIRLRTLDELERFAEMAASSTAVPKDYQGKPANCMVAIQMGSELGLAPMQSLQNIAVVNGRPAVWGDAMPGLCRASGMMAYMREWSDGEGGELTWHCETKRRDDPNPVRRDFSVADAKTAKLWGKKGYNGQDTPWITNPGRMLQMRARGFALRDAFPDVLRGLISAEEAEDIPTGKTIEGEPPADARKALNDSIPLKSVAATMPRGESVQDTTVYDTADDPHEAYDACPKCRGTGEFRPGMKCFACNGTGNTAKQPIVTGKDTAPAPERTREAWVMWINGLIQACDKQTSREGIEAIAARPSVEKALAEAPPWAKDEIDAIIGDFMAKLPAAEPGDDLDEVVIEGHEKLAAG